MLYSTTPTCAKTEKTHGPQWKESLKLPWGPVEMLFDLFQSLLVLCATFINVSAKNEVPTALAAAGCCCYSPRVLLRMIDRELKIKETQKPP